jgi:23S rRNA (uracil1939-C5)-methyltransferase
MNAPTLQKLTIAMLGQRGEGVAQGPAGRVFTPYAAPGDIISASVEGERGQIAEILTPGPDRIAPFCPWFATCGGCAIQHIAPVAYAEWKRGLVVAALAHAGVAAQVGALVDAHGAGRRRATFHARMEGTGPGATAHVGFMRARAHAIVEIGFCPILAPEMAGALPAARALAQSLAGRGKPLDILVTATREGLDIDLRGAGRLDDAERQRLIATAASLDLARLSNHGETLIARRTPSLVMGEAVLRPSPGAFLQATQAGEETLARQVIAAVGEGKRVADLFAGVGTFALRLAGGREIFAVESDSAALAALERASHAPTLRAVKTDQRDLFRRPLAGDELRRFDAVVFDPPRVGAQAQAQALAASPVPTLVAVSCAAQTFARDAKILVEGGYRLESVTPIDQFRHSPHVEIVGVFRRAAKGARPKRRLLG